jgi:hypothetical protein
VDTGSGKSKLDTSYCLPAEWFTLPADERKKILAAHTKNGKNGKNKDSGKGKGKGSSNSFVGEKTKWKLVALASQLVDAFEDDDGESGGNGNRDGSNGEKKKKSAVESSLADQFGRRKNAVVHFVKGLQELGGKKDE